MSKAKDAMREAIGTETDRLTVEYCFSRFGRGRRAEDRVPGRLVVVLDPDMARIFRDSAAVNHALRRLLQLEAAAGGGRGQDVP